MPDLNTLIAAYYMADAQAKEIFRQVVQECLARGEKIDQLQNLIKESKKAEANQPA